jgi:hypothetical protein
MTIEHATERLALAWVLLDQFLHELTDSPSHILSGLSGRIAALNERFQFGVNLIPLNLFSFRLFVLVHSPRPYPSQSSIGGPGKKSS